MTSRPIRAVLATFLLLLAVGASAASASLAVTPDPTWGTDGRVEVIKRVGNTIYLGGTFANLRDTQSAQTLPVSNLVGIDATTGAPTSFAPAVNGTVFAMAPSPDGTRLYVAGNFTTVNGVKHQRIAAFDTSTGALLAWKPYGWPNNVVRALAVTSNAVYFGGDFSKVGSAAVTRIAAASPTTGAAIGGFSANADALVRRLLVTNGRLYVGGNFNNVNGTPQAHLTAIDPTTGATIAGVYHPSYPVLDLALGSALYVGGGGGGGKALAVNPTTGAKLWEIKTDGNVQAVSVLNGVPYFGGHFLKYGSTAVGQLARANPATGALDTTWLPQVTDGYLGVFALAGSAPNQLYVGGDFTRVTAVPAYNFAQLTDGSAPPVADLGVTLTAAPASVTAGQNVTYTANVSNAGPGAAPTTVLTDVLPAGLTFVSASTGCTYASATRTVSCALGTVTTAGATATITVSADAAGSSVNSISVDSGADDPNPANDSDTATVAVTGGSGADLAVSTTAPAKVNMGTAVTVTVTVTNKGPDAASGVTLTDTPPTNATLGSVTPAAGSCSGTTTISCALGAIPAGGSVKVTIALTAPGSPQTLLNTASVSGAGNDPISSNNAATTFISAVNPAASGDTTAPARTAMTMLDTNHDGFVDTVTVTFGEPLAACAAPCTDGWVLQNVPGGGVLQSVTTAGSVATLHLGGWTDQPDTAVTLFTIALNAPNEIQDAAGNHASYAAAAPSDGAGPVPVGFRHQHNSSGACAGTTNVNGTAEVCDELTSEWSEPLLKSSVGTTTAITITDPVGAGNDTVTIPGFLGGPLDLGSPSYLTLDGSSATWASSLLVLSSAGDALTARIFGPCTGTGCANIANVKQVTVTYVPAGTLTDAPETRPSEASSRPRRCGEDKCIKGSATFCASVTLVATFSLGPCTKGG